MRRGRNVSLQNSLSSKPQRFLRLGESLARRKEHCEGFSEPGWVEGTSLFRNKRDRTAQEGRIQKSSKPLRTMIHEGIKANFAVTLSIKRRDIVQGQHVAFWGVAAFQIQNLHAPGRVPRGFIRSKEAWCGRNAKFVRSVSGEGDGLGGPDAGKLVMAVAGV